jgi:hypothetical protein
MPNSYSTRGEPTLDLLRNVNITDVSNKDVIQYNSTSGVWENGKIDLTPVILGASLTNSFYTGANPRSVVVYENVEYETVSCYDALTGIFTAPRTAYYMVNAYARVTDFSSPFASRAQSFIYKKVGGVFTKYSATDVVDAQENYKSGTPSTNIIIYLNSGEEIRHEVTFPGNTTYGYLIRGDAFETRCSYLSIHSIN